MTENDLLMVDELGELVHGARASKAAFFELVIRQEPEQTPIRIAPHQQLFLDFVAYHPRCVVRMPRGFSKTFLTAGVILTDLGEDAALRTAVISDSEGQAAKPVGMVRDYIELPGPIRAVYPELAPSVRRGDHWTQTKLVVDRPAGIRDPSVYALGYQGKVLGSRLDAIYVDDILSHENTRTKEACLAVRKWFSNLLPTLDVRPGRVSRVLVTNTPWDQDDLTYALEKAGWPSLTMDVEGNIWICNTDWDTDLVRPGRDCPEPAPGPGGKLVAADGPYRLVAHDSPRYLEPVYVRRVPLNPNVDEEEVVPLWPEKFNRAWIERTKNDPEQALTWGPNYMMTCRDEATARCKTEWISACKKNARDAGHYRMLANLGGSGLALIGTYTGVDPAFGMNAKKHDLSAIVTIGVLPNMKRLILAVDGGHYAGSLLIDKIFQHHAVYQSIIRVETNAAQTYLKQWANERNIGVPIRAHNTGGKNKWDPRHGVETIFVEIEQGAWLFPNDQRTQRCELQLEALLRDCMEYDPKGHTGDYLMALWLAREQARASGALLKASRDEGPSITLR
jgi:hypothetical protein